MKTQPLNTQKQPPSVFVGWAMAALLAIAGLALIFFSLVPSLVLYITVGAMVLLGLLWVAIFSFTKRPRH